MMYKAKVAVCSDIRTKHSSQSEYHVEFLNVKLMVRKVTARGYKVKGVQNWRQKLIFKLKNFGFVL